MNARDEGAKRLGPRQSGERPPIHPLQSLHVVEISDRVAGDYCGKLLRDAGADVVKFERGRGVPLRRYVPVGGGDLSDGQQSCLFEYLNGGKRSIVIPHDEMLPVGLLAQADAIIVTANPSQAKRIGFDPGSILTIAPRAVVVSISSFGWTGEWAEHPATEFTLQAWCGCIGFRGVPPAPPVSVGGDLGEYIAGAYAAFFAAATIHGVARGGRGIHADVSMLEAMSLSMQAFEWLHTDLIGIDTVPPTLEVPSIETAADGYVGIAMVTGQQWLDFTSMVNCPELAERADLQLQHARWEHRDYIESMIAPWFQAHTVSETVQLATYFRIPASEIGNGAMLPQNKHFVERGVFVQNPAGFLQPRPPWLMSVAAPQAVAPAPGPGDTAASDVEQQWGIRNRHVPEHDLQSAPDGRPLTGLRIVDLTNFWAGPGATQLLAAMGADVIKIESVQRPDGIRYTGAAREDVEHWWEYGWVFHGANTDKRDITLNLQSPRGRAIFAQLVAQADVVVENYAPRVLDQFNLSYPALAQWKDDIILVRMPAFGLTGPDRDRVGFAMTMEQLAGLAWLTGYHDGPPVTPRGPCDALAGVHAAFVIVAAVEYRRRTGCGQLVEVPMIESVLNATALQVMEYTRSGALLTRRGNRGHSYAVQNVYACSGNDNWIAVSVRDDRDWAALCSVLGDPQWAGRYLHANERWEAQDVIHERLGAWFAEQDLGAVVHALVAAGVPAAPVVAPPDITENPQLRERNFLEPMDHPVAGTVRYPRPPVMPLGDYTRFWRTAAPTLGQHNREILCNTVGIDSAEFAELEDRGVIGMRPAGL